MDLYEAERQIRETMASNTSDEVKSNELIAILMAVYNTGVRKE